MTTKTVQIRRAAPGDEAVIAHHRVGMFRDMGKLPAERETAVREAAITWITPRLASGEYLGWLAFHGDRPDEIIGGAGVHLRDAPPAITARGNVRSGKQALVINVFTERAARHRGIARALMKALLTECKKLDVMNVVLHASDEGRPLYESLGFVATNEMRLVED